MANLGPESIGEFKAVYTGMDFIVQSPRITPSTIEAILDREDRMQRCMRGEMVVRGSESNVRQEMEERNNGTSD